VSPLPAPSNRRTSPRIEVFAQAEVKAHDVQIMEVRNVSAGGIYLVGTPEGYPELMPGKDLGLVIFGSEEGLGDDPEFNITCHARVIRIDLGNPGKRPPGFGATIDPVDEDSRQRLTKLLLRADSFRVGDPRR
jgi:PilZ domain